MKYEEAVEWLRFQEKYTERDIYNLLKGIQAVIVEDLKLIRESEGEY